MTQRPSLAAVRTAGRPRSLVAGAAAALLALGLAACQRAPEMDPTPANASATERAALRASIPGPEGDPSVPDAQAALSAAGAAAVPQPPASAALAEGPRNPPMTEQQQSTQMPLPGQANDHSVATTPGTSDGAS